MAVIYDWSTTPSSNVTVNGVSVAENCPAANINNAIREVMAASRNTFASGLQNFLAGTSPLAVASGGTGLSAALTTNALVKQGASNFAASIVSDDGSTATVTGALSVTGNVGIGTSSPGARLAINGGAGTSQTRFEVSTTDVQEVATNAAVAAYANRITDAAQHIWKVTGSERVRIDSSGNVGIGTSSPLRKLHTYTGSAADIRHRVENTVNSTEMGLLATGEAFMTSSGAFPLIMYTNSSERLRIDSSGNVGVGTSSPGAKLDVSGSANFSGNAFVASGSGFWLGGNGAFGVGIASSSGVMSLYTNSTAQLTIATTGGITSANVADAVGYKGAPNSNPTTGSAITLTAAQMGKRTPNTSGGWVVPASLPADGVWILHNNSSSTQTITASGTTLTLQGTTTTGTRTVAPNGLATVTQIDSSNSFLVGGNVT